MVFRDRNTKSHRNERKYKGEIGGEGSEKNEEQEEEEKKEKAIFLIRNEKNINFSRLYLRGDSGNAVLL